MGIIRVLSAEVAGRIAAGEVIERPASVIKELVENSIDAGARRIRVLTEQGGTKMMQVIDDGKGMERDDAILCLQAHATSKIATESDVGQIHTLGFRGEALPSISSVSRFELQTRRHEDLTGTEVVVDNGTILTVRDCGCAPGTSIKASYLFGNLPARRKFLKGPATEDDRIEEMLRMLALTRPEIAFDLIQNGRTVLHAPSANNYATRVQMLLGKDAFAAMLPVDYTEDGVHLYGFISAPGFTRNSRREQRLIVNRRAASADTIYYAIRTAYATLVPSGRYPGAVLYLDLPDDRVDVNVHPSKREVRFREPMKIAAIVAAGLRVALRAMASAPTFASESAAVPPAVTDDERPVVVDTTPTGSPTALPASQGQLPHDAAGQPAPLPPPIMPREINFEPIQTPLRFAPSDDVSTTQNPPPASGAATPFTVPTPTQSATPSAPQSAPQFHSHSGSGAMSGFTLLGRLEKGYLLAETSSGLVVINVRAASQRIVFERMLANLKNEHVEQQQLLLPITVSLSPDEARLLSREQEHFRAIGYTVEPFGNNTFIITAVPANFQSGDMSTALRDILTDLRRDTVTNRQSAIHVAQTASRHAVSNKEHLTVAEQEALIAQLLSCEMPYADPAGLPTMVNISYSELKQRFQS